MSSQDLLDDDAINQLLDMDEGDDHDFSTEIFQEFFEQLEEKLPQFDLFIEHKQYENAAKLGHFLKGSSAGVGAAKIRDICDVLQHYEDNTNENNVDIFFHQHVDDLKKYILETKKAIREKVGIIL